MKSPAKYLVAIFVMLLAASCSSFFDDLSKCITPRLHFVYYADGTDDVLPNYIKDGRLYIYDETGKLHHSQILGSAALREGVELKDIHSGKWTVVAWGNLTDATERREEADLVKATLTALPDKDGIYRTTDSLYYAEYVLDFSKIKSADVEVPFSAAHVSLDVVVKGFDATHAGRTPLLKVAPSGTKYTLAGYNGKITVNPTELKSFLPYTGHSQSDDLYRARFDLFRIDQIADVAITLNDAADEAMAPYVTVPLHQYVTEHKIPLRGRHEVNIPVLITFEQDASYGLIVKVNTFEWNSIQIKPDGYKQ